MSEQFQTSAGIICPHGLLFQPVMILNPSTRFREIMKAPYKFLDLLDY